MRVRIQFTDEHTDIDVTRETEGVRTAAGGRIVPSRTALLDDAIAHVRRALDIEPPTTATAEQGANDE